MKLLSAVILLAVVGSHVQAASVGNIVQVSRKLKMTANEPLSPKDYFISLGERDGVSVGSILEVSREMPVVNGLSGEPGPTLRLKLGTLKVVLVGETTSVARVDMERSPSEIPTTELTSFLVGDDVSIQTPAPALNVVKEAPPELPPKESLPKEVGTP